MFGELLTRARPRDDRPAPSALRQCSSTDRRLPVPSQADEPPRPGESRVSTRRVSRFDTASLAFRHGESRVSARRVSRFDTASLAFGDGSTTGVGRRRRRPRRPPRARRTPLRRPCPRRATRRAQRRSPACRPRRPDRHRRPARRGRAAVSAGWPGAEFRHSGAAARVWREQGARHAEAGRRDRSVSRPRGLTLVALASRCGRARVLRDASFACRRRESRRHRSARLGKVRPPRPAGLSGVFSTWSTSRMTSWLAAQPVPELLPGEQLAGDQLARPALGTAGSPGRPRAAQPHLLVMSPWVRGLIPTPLACPCRPAPV